MMTPLMDGGYCANIEVVTFNTAFKYPPRIVMGAGGIVDASYYAGMTDMAFQFFAASISNTGFLSRLRVKEAPTSVSTETITSSTSLGTNDYGMHKTATNAPQDNEWVLTFDITIANRNKTETGGSKYITQGGGWDTSVYYESGYVVMGVYGASTLDVYTLTAVESFSATPAASSAGSTTTLSDQVIKAYFYIGATHAGYEIRLTMLESWNAGSTLDSFDSTVWRYPVGDGAYAVAVPDDWAKVSWLAIGS
jgi:hypothetical protein